MNELKVALLQSDLVWENAEENRIKFSNGIVDINDTVDLIILPEMFTTGFSMNANDLYETMTGDTVNWMQKMASIKNAAITGSLIVSENGNYYNRLLFVYPNGKIEQYDKRHTFTLAGEHNIYTSGNKKLVLEYKGWKICPQICYDLRFPAWSRNTEDYDVLIYVANWPKIRIKAWDTLLQARAIENMSYCIGVNRVGLDGNDYEYVGHSAAYDMLGERLHDINDNNTITQLVTLNKSQLQEIRSKLNFLADRDEIVIKERFPHNQN